VQNLQAAVESCSGRAIQPASCWSTHGQFPLVELINALPAGGAQSVEAPVAADAGQTPTARAVRAHAAATDVLAAAMA
jgi:hypothetical protein